MTHSLATGWDGQLEAWYEGWVKDLQAGEHFIRVIGERQRPPAGEPPTAAAREALGKMARYRTRAPKGVFIYKSHEEANKDRERWLLDAMVAKAKAASEEP